MSEFSGRLFDSMHQRAQPMRGFKGDLPQPSLDLDEDGAGTLQTPGMPDRDYSSAEILETMGLSPDTHVVNNLRVRKWQIYDGSWLASYGATVRPRYGVELDVEALISHVRNRQFTADRADGPDGFVVCLSDYQIGKGENGGTERTIDRIMRCTGMVEQRIEELRTLGRPLGELAILGLGDLVEGCDGQYSTQAFQVDLNRREQIRLVAEILFDQIVSWAPHFERVSVAAVGGNHGENRKNGKKYTADGDNDDLMVFEWARSVVRHIPELEHVKFYLPEDERYMALNVGGVSVGLTHGDLMGNRRNHVWWKDQVFGQSCLADCQLLCNAHFHHFMSEVHGLRTNFQVPAMDNGSKWYRDMRGDDAPSGMLTFRTGRDLLLGWDDLKILTPDVATA